MNKEEILSKSRQENKQFDERERILSSQAMSYGVVGMAITFIILFFVQMPKEGHIYNLLALYFSYLASANIFKYKLLKGKINLISALSFTFAAIVYLYIYITRV